MVNNNHCNKSKGKYPANALLVKSFNLQRISKRRPLFCQVQNFSYNQTFSAPAQWLLMSSLRKELKKSLHSYNVQVCNCVSMFRNWRSHFASFNDEKKMCSCDKYHAKEENVTNSWKFFRCPVGLANIALVQFCRSLEASTISKGTWRVHQRAIM